MPKKAHKYGMVIDVDRCIGCNACSTACAAENNVAPAPGRATERTSITPMRVERVVNQVELSSGRVSVEARFLPVLCMQCEHETPCVSVCPQQAVEVDRESGIVFQMAERCLGCRYCMTACPYHARYFNWWDPSWPAGMENTLNPGVAPRMRGVVEKCNFCHARLQAAQDKAAAGGKREIDPHDYVPACVDACPTAAITFGDLADAASDVARQAHDSQSFRLLEKLGTQPKVYYRSDLAWVRELADRGGAAPHKELAEIGKI